MRLALAGCWFCWGHAASLQRHLRSHIEMCKDVSQEQDGEESGFYFNMKHFKDLMQGSEWDELERYLSSFNKVENDCCSMKTAPGSTMPDGILHNAGSSSIINGLLVPV